MSNYALHNLTLEPYQVETIIQAEITHKFNEHSQAYIKAIIPEEQNTKAIEQTTSESIIEINAQNEEGEDILFKGIVQKIKITNQGELYYLEINAISYTYIMDIHPQNRSYQDKTMKYEELIKQVIKNYKGSNFLNNTPTKSTNAYLLQYEETDWEYIKRIASHHNTGLIPAIDSDNLNFTIGMPKDKNKGQLDQYNYYIEKNISNYLNKHKTTNYKEEDSLTYVIDTGIVLQVGDHVEYEGKKLYVTEAKGYSQTRRLIYQYKLSSENSITITKNHNQKISGISLEGEVTEVTKDKIKVQLTIDTQIGETTELEKAHQYTYTTTYTAEGESGYYVMPEIGDTVLIYHPSSDESQAIAMNSIRKTEGKKTNQPEEKIFRTKEGKEIKFNKTEIQITAKDEETYIKISDKQGIEIKSKKPIKIESSKKCTLQANKKLILTAKEKLVLNCKNSRIRLDGKVIMKGKAIKQN